MNWKISETTEKFTCKYAINKYFRNKQYQKYLSLIYDIYEKTTILKDNGFLKLNDIPRKPLSG